MLKGLGIPYMGSKRKLAPKILTKIMQDNPNTKYIFDLFGGGGSISFMAMQIKGIKQVHYNEFNPAIVALLRDIMDNGVTDKYYKWVSREEFKKNVDRTDWYGGLLKTVWSFGNNQKAYLFGKDIEASKKLLHGIAVDNNYDNIKKFKNMFDFKFDSDVLHKTFKKKTIEQRRTIIMRMIKNTMNRFDVQQLERLSRMQHLQNLQNLQVTNLSYEQVEINTPIDETVIYLDPPYKGTAEYDKSIDFKKLTQWIKDSPYKIYLSEYNNTHNMKLVKSFKHRGLLSSNNEVVENLYRSY